VLLSGAGDGTKSRWETATELRDEWKGGVRNRTDGGWIELNDDNDDDVALKRLNTYHGIEGGQDDAEAMPGLPAVGHQRGMKFTSLAAESSKARDDFVFLSDDFDSSINLDKEYALPGDLQLPPAKRLRVSPRPERLPTLPPFKRTVSDITAGSRYGTSRNALSKTHGLKRSATVVTDDDPITFTSSPDFVQLAKERRERRRREAEQEKELSEVEEVVPSRPTGKHTALEPLDDSSDGLPDIDIIASQARSGPIPTLSRHNSQRAMDIYNAQKASVSKPPPKASEKPKRIVKTAAEKLAEKEAEAERKRLIREDKARDKQIAADLAKVNTLRTDKKISTTEMIVLFPRELDEKLRTQAQNFLGKLSVECAEWHGEGSVRNCVRWRRKVEARYDEKEGHWVPVPRRVEDENHVLCHMPAAEFVELATAEEGKDLDAHVLRMKSRFERHAIIYLVEGLNAWMRKNRNVRNRQFTEAVRAQMAAEADGVGGGQRSRRKKTVEWVDEDMIEDALLRLQVMHGALIHHTAALVESAEWITVFTQHISTVPYRRQRMGMDTAFCMETGQIKTGEDAADTYVKMLQEVNRVTAPIAYGIAAEYPSVTRLVEGFRREGKDALMRVRKSANRDGAFTDKEVGKSVSKRIWSIFMGREEGSTDV
jgi:crossover junction endonuclease EME1